MFAVIVEPYCNNCPNFVANTEFIKEKRNGIQTIVETRIQCRNKEKCKELLTLFPNNVQIGKK